MTSTEFTADEQRTAIEGIAASLEELRRTESVVESLVDAGACSHAALYAQVAAHRAWRSHAGVFVSPAIESALVRAAGLIEHAALPSAPDVRDRPRVLHVASEVGFPEGGHGRLIERWMRSDTARTHGLALTLPRREIPSMVVATVEASGGTVHHVAPGSASFVDRARDLGRIAAGYDMIVLHTHPFDPLPILALAWPGRPPTILSNHAPHVFWLGRAVADAVTYGRDHAARICVDRRGIPAEACVRVPVPVESQPPASPADRERIRRELGVPDRALLLVSVASGYKFGPVRSEHDLARTVAEAVARRKRVVWRVLGPTSDGRWAELAEQTRGAVRAVGVRSDEGLYAAADAFIDSHPFTARTALLDAASAGIPLLAPRWHTSETEILSAFGGVIDDAMLTFTDVTSLSAHLDMLSDPAQRLHHGRRAAESVAGVLVGRPVAETLEAAYRVAAERTHVRDARGVVPHAEPAARAPDDLDFYLRRLHASTEPLRVLINWHRDDTNRGSAEAFPAEESSLTTSRGLAALVGEQDLIIRDLEATVAELRAELAAAPSATNADQQPVGDADVTNGRRSRRRRS